MNYSMIKAARNRQDGARKAKPFRCIKRWRSYQTLEERKGNDTRWRWYSPGCFWPKWLGKRRCKESANGCGCARDGYTRSCPTRAQFPCAATYSKVLRSVDPEQINQLLMELLTRVRTAKRTKGEHTHVVLDGKTLCGTQGHLAEDQQKMHQMNFYEAKTGIILKQRMVAEKTGELTHMQEFLTPTLLKGRIISADTLYTQQAFCQQVIASGGDYLLFVKRNQPTLHEDAPCFFTNPPLDCLDWRTDCMAEKGHGRQTSRQIRVFTELNLFGTRLA